MQPIPTQPNFLGYRQDTLLQKRAAEDRVIYSGKPQPQDPFMDDHYIQRATHALEGGTEEQVSTIGTGYLEEKAENTLTFTLSRLIKGNGFLVDLKKIDLAEEDIMRIPKDKLQLFVSSAEKHIKGVKLPDFIKKYLE